VDQNGIRIAPGATAGSFTNASAYAFTVPTGTLGLYGWDADAVGVYRGLTLGSHWSGAGTKVNQIEITASNSSFLGTAQLVLTGTGTSGSSTAVLRANTITLAGGSLDTPVVSIQGELDVAGEIVSTKPGGRLFLNQSGGTAASFMRVINTSGDAIWGLEGSAGGAIFTGTAAYATVIGSLSNTRLQFATNGAKVVEIDTNGDLFPAGDGTTSGRFCGIPTHRWDAVYAQNGAIQTSDASLKRDIRDTDLGTAFLLALRPKSWKWVDGTDTRRHYGFTSQDVADALGAKADGFGGLYRHPGAADGLNYSMFIAPLVAGFQNHEARLLALEGQLPA
jgi:hypothetical protein